MALPIIAGLKQATWRTLSPSERLESLNQLENAIAAQEARSPCDVLVIPESAYAYPEQRELLQGFHPSNSHEIFINEALINPDASHAAVYSDGTVVNANDSYMAVETLLHEDRHAHQEYVAYERPDLAESPLQLQDFQKNNGDGYLSAETFDPEYYLMQPIERDARASARQGMNEIYADQYQTDPSYLKHTQRMENAEGRYAEMAEDSLGDNYEEVVRQKAFERYEVYQAENQGESSSLAEQTKIGDGLTPSLEDDYFYGYGL